MVLRSISKDGEQENIDLGRQYRLINRYISPESFKECANYFYGADRAGDFIKELHGFVIHHKTETDPVLKENENVILSDNGEVFDPLPAFNYKKPREQITPES
jgi:hypothetical protein